MGLSLREAADATGVAKSTIFRAIKAGRLSAARTDDGNFSVDPAELFRVYEAKQRGVEQSAAQDAIPDVAATIARLEARLEATKLLLDAATARIDDIRIERDRWADQANRLALPAPARRSWWRK